MLCIISQHPWFAFYYKILQVTEQLLKQDNVLNTFSKQQLAQTHPASLFLTDLCHQCPELPIPGRVIRYDKSPMLHAVPPQAACCQTAFHVFDHFRLVSIALLDLSQPNLSQLVQLCCLAMAE